MAMLAVLCLPLVDPGLHRAGGGDRAGLAGIQDQGPHGFTEMLYAYTSGTGNNGSAFAGLTAQHALLQHRRSASRC